MKNVKWLLVSALCLSVAFLPAAHAAKPFMQRYRDYSEAGAGSVTERKAAMSDEEFLELCEDGTPEEIKRAIEGGANLNAQGEDGTPLILAAENQEDTEVLSMLLERGADVNETDPYGDTALHYAAYFNHNPEVVKMLIANGANVNGKGRYERTPLMHAVQGGEAGNITALLDAGADAGIEDEDGKKAIDHMPEELSSWTDKDEWDAAIKRLKSAGGNAAKPSRPKGGNAPASSYVLQAEEADLSQAPDVILEGSPRNLGGWRVRNKVSFTADLKQPGAYTVFLDYSKEASVGDRANLRITFKNEAGGSLSISGRLPSTGDSWANYTNHEFAAVWPLAAGKTIITLESTNPEGDGYVMNLRSVTLRR